MESLEFRTNQQGLEYLGTYWFKTAITWLLNLYQAILIFYFLISLSIQMTKKPSSCYMNYEGAKEEVRW